MFFRLRNYYYQIYLLNPFFDVYLFFSWFISVLIPHLIKFFLHFYPDFSIYFSWSVICTFRIIISLLCFFSFFFFWKKLIPIVLNSTIFQHFICLFLCLANFLISSKYNFQLFFFFLSLCLNCLLAVKNVGNNLEKEFYMPDIECCSLLLFVVSFFIRFNLIIISVLEKELYNVIPQDKKNFCWYNIYQALVSFIGMQFGFRIINGSIIYTFTLKNKVLLFFSDYPLLYFPLSNFQFSKLKILWREYLDKSIQIKSESSVVKSELVQNYVEEFKKLGRDIANEAYKTNSSFFWRSLQGILLSYIVLIIYYNYNFFWGLVL